MKSGMDTVIEQLHEQTEATRQRSITEQLEDLDAVISAIEQLAYSDPATPSAVRRGLCECVRQARILPRQTVTSAAEGMIAAPAPGTARAPA